MSDMLHRLLQLPLAAGFLISMIGCSPAENASSSQAPAAVTAPATIENAQLAGGQAGLQQAIVAARQDLAGRRGKEVDSIQVLEADAVNWRSGAIGCPQRSAALALTKITTCDSTQAGIGISKLYDA